MARARGADVIEVGNQKYKLTTFRIIADHECGTPEECRLIPDQHTAEVREGDRFMACYVPVVVFKGESAVP